MRSRRDWRVQAASPAPLLSLWLLTLFSMRRFTKGYIKVRVRLTIFAAVVVSVCFPCRADMALAPLPYQGIAIRGWIGQQMREDAANGWINICDRMARQGFLGWDANTQQAIPYYLPWSKGGGQGPAAWNRSVPYYQPIIEPMGSYGEGEFEGHWLDGAARLGWIADVKEFRTLARQAAKDIVTTRDPSGYIGVDAPWFHFTGMYTTPFGLKNGEFEISGMMAIVDGLMTYYRYTHDEQVLKACVKATDLVIEKTRGREFKDTAGLLAPLGFLAMYRETRNKAYLDRAVMLVEHDYGEMFGKQMATETGGIKGHAASTGIVLLSMLAVYEANGDRRFLKNAVALNDRVVRHAMQVHGVPTGHGEELASSGPNVNTEGCVITWFSWAWLEMLRATGDARYADMVEKAILNALPGQRSKDGAASPYFARPNQLYAVRGSGMGTVYGARVFVECCHGNLGRILPVVAENIVLRTNDGGLSVPFYVESTFHGDLPNAGKIELTQQTEYPFSETIRILVNPEHSAAFPVRLRVPSWCNKPIVTVNGAAAAAGPIKGWLELNRTWSAGDAVDLTLPMNVRVEVAQNGLASVERGPLVYALAVEGRRRSRGLMGLLREVHRAREQVELCAGGR